MGSANDSGQRNDTPGNADETKKSENDKSKPSTTRAREEEELLRWPYTIHAIEDTLDADFIEGRGKQLLFQALNQRNAVAFVGSGLPMAFGRLSWDDWQREQVDLVTAVADAFIECSRASLNLIDATISLVDPAENDKETTPIRHNGTDLITLLQANRPILARFLRIKKSEIVFRNEEVTRLFRTLSSLGSDGAFIGGEGHPIVFQVAEKLQDVLTRGRDVFLNPSLDAADQERAKTIPRKHARFGFLENSKTSPAPQALLKGIAPLADSVFCLIGAQGEDKIPEETLNSFLSAFNGIDDSNRDRVRTFVESLTRYQYRLRRYDETTGAPEARLRLSDIAKVLLIDECAHAERMIRNAVDYSHESGRQPWQFAKSDYARRTADNTLRQMLSAASLESLRRDVQGIRDNPKRYGSLAYFKTQAFLALCANLSKLLVDPQWSKILTLLENQLRDNTVNAVGPRRDVRRVFVSPTHRFVFSMLMAHYSDPYKELDLTVKPEIPEPNTTPPLIAEHVVEQDLKSRRSIIDSALDPLEIVAMRLGISRFLTTNYDLEIERFYQDRGYRHFSDSSSTQSTASTLEARHHDRNSYRVDGLGGVFRDQAFQRDRAANLIAFSLDEASADAHVFHLHGRTTRDSTMVVTERSYMDLYLRQDVHREAVDESIRVAFAANPLVFLGLGMREADVLRPLRQFMSDKDRAVSRTSIAVLAGLDSRENQAKQAATIHLRYGTHAIYYGFAFIEADQRGQTTEDEQWIKLDWLHHVNELIKHLKTTNKEMRKILVAALDTPPHGEGGSRESFWKSLRPALEGDRQCDLAVAPEIRLSRLVEAMGERKDPHSDRGEMILFLLLGRRVNRNVARREFETLLNTDSQPKSLALPYFSSWCSAGKTHRKERRAVESHTLYFECGLLGQLLWLTINNPLPESIEGLIQAYKAHPYFVPDNGDVPVSGEISDDFRKAIRELNARIIGLEGLQNAIITGALCASLEKLEQERQEWWRDWQLSPPHRVARFEARKPRWTDGHVYLPRRYMRHRLAKSSTETSDLTKVASKVRDMHRGVTGVRSFDTFLDAIEARMAKDTRYAYTDGELAFGRRWHCVSAPRGMGRGAFLSALQTPQGLGQYIASSWPGTSSASSPLYVSAIFVSVGFSTEIASTFDMLADALLDTVVTVRGATTYAAIIKTEGLTAFLAVENNAWEEKQNVQVGGDTSVRSRLERDLKPLSRIRRLELLLDHYGHAVTEVQQVMIGIRPRFLLCINGIDMLHYAGGLPKNREIEEFLALVTKAELRQHPYDLLLVTGEENIGELFTEGTPFLKRYVPVISKYEESQRVPTAEDQVKNVRERPIFVSIVRPGIDDKGVQTVDGREHKSGVVVERAWKRVTSAGPVELEDLPSGARPRDVCYFHFARVMRPENLLIDDFLPLATVLYLHNDKHYRAGDPSQNSVPYWDKDDSARRDSEMVMEALRVPSISTPSQGDGTDDSKLVQYIGGRETLTLSCVWQKAKPKDCHEAHVGLTSRRLERAKKVLGYALRFIEKDSRAESLEVEQVLLGRYGSPTDPHYDAQAVREWRDIRAILGSNRYCLTILLAAAQHLALSGRTISDGAQRAEAFIRQTVDHVKAVSASEREEAVLHDVLDAYEASHAIGEPHNDVELHLLILRHLAAIGSPCSADVLVRTPQILRYFDLLPEDRERSRSLRLTQALTVLTERGLVFRLSPHPQLIELYKALKNDTKKKEEQFERGESPKYAYRYALHRLMQRHILRKIGSGPREFAEVNSFAPSLYASMPADLPRLNHEAYRFLSGLVDSLAQYPDRDGTETADQRWHFGDASHTTRVQALRCALSLVRSTFSVAVVSRFEDYNSLATGIDRPPRGYFESYRVQVRWLIRKAWEVYARDNTFNPLDYQPEDAKPKQLQAFYRDEIVWLYNECGVVCLVQGNLLEAAALVRQAIHFNRCIEGNRDGGAQYNRLSLNLAITQIERGHLENAASRLSAICQSERQYGSRVGRIWHIAHGYLGLVQHLRGDRDAAAKHYERAIEVLRVYDDLRSCSIFSKHLGDLQRARGVLADAHRHIKNAIGFAQAGGHEDLHKRALLSRVLLDIAERKTTDFSIQSTLAQLRLIEEYAETMEMPSLLCDVFISRARLLLDQGESTLAGSLLARAMALAKRNGMNLRLNSAMTSYARVLAMRDLKDQAEQLLFTCLAMAKRNNNQIEIAGVEAASDALHHVSRFPNGRATR